MAEIDGGSLSFKSVLDNDQLNSAIEETMRRVQGLSDAFVGSGDVVDKTAEGIRTKLGLIGVACEAHEQALADLGREYDRLGEQMDNAFINGNDDEFRAIQEKRKAIQGEMTVRRQLLSDLREQSNALEEEAVRLEMSATQTEMVAQSHASLRTRIKELKEEMATLIADGIDEQSEAYKALVVELGRLMDIQGDIQAQGTVLANDEAHFQGLIQGISGVTGAFSAAQGAVSLFADENENLHKIMLKVQSLMSITMGLQQVAQTLNKDSAFQLVTMNKLKEWWNRLLAIGRGEQIAETAALTTNTVAQGANAAAIGTHTAVTTAGTTATIGFAGALRMVGAAIKGIPVLGWVVAGISALIAVVSHFVGKAREAKKAQEEWYQSVAENCYKPIASIEDLSMKWNALGDNLEAKKRFIEQNKRAFDDLGVAVNGVEDAENLLVKNKTAFINAQIEKAKAMLLYQQTQEKVKTLMEKEQEYSAMPDTTSQFVQTSSGQWGGSSGYYVEGENRAKKKLGEEIAGLKAEIEQGFKDAAAAESEGYKKLQEAGIDALGTYKAGTLGAIEQAIQEKQAALKNLTDAKEYQAAMKEIEALQKQADAITGGKKETKIEQPKKDAEKDAKAEAEKKMREETEALLAEYASYTEQKRRIDEQYAHDYELLMAKRAKATSDAERAEIDAAIANREKQRDKDVNAIGGNDYDALLAEYGTFEQRKQAIIDEYEEKRKAAQVSGNAEMIEALNQAQAEALSKFALDELQAHPDWELMFGNLDEISTQKLQELIDKINNLDGAYLGINFDPKDLEVLKEKIKAMKDEINDRNPFKALISSVKEYGKATDDEGKKKSLTAMFSSASDVIELVGGTLDAVTAGLDKMGVEMDEGTQAVVNDISGIISGAGQIASGIASGNPLAIIQGSIGLLTSALDLFNSKDRKAERQIKAHAATLKDLKKEYNELEYAIDNALGGDVYSGQMDAIENMKKQQEEIKAMREAEESKKKADKDKLEEYDEQMAELERNINDKYAEISNDLLQTTAKDFSTQLADALTSAFAAGEDSAKAFEQTVNDVLKNVIVNQLKKKFLDKQLQGALDQLERDMGYWDEGGNFVFDGLTDEEIAAYKAKVKQAADNYEQAMEIYSGVFKDAAEEDASGLTGAVKGVSEETASIIAGQMNAIRINQLETADILRQQLQATYAIAQNTRYLARIERIIYILENSGNSLRSQGLS